MMINSGCSTAGILDRSGKRFGSSDIVNAMITMNERNNGLGAGFAVYGAYPDNKENYALHMVYNDEQAKDAAERFIKEKLKVIDHERIPTKERLDAPQLYRYFVKVPNKNLISEDEDSYMIRCVNYINTNIKDAFVMSSGKNLGVFKGVGFPDEIAEFYKLDRYKGHMWTAHGRFPTNTPGSWFGAHPFNLLDLSVVHNGEVSSYGANKRYLKGFGYNCSLKTDTEVFVYLFDLLLKRHNLPIRTACKAIAPQFWSLAKDDKEKRELEIIRRVYRGAIVNGPFSIIVAHKKGMFGLNDRIKLRPMIAAEKDNWFLIASEEAALKRNYKDFDKIWEPESGNPAIGELDAD